MQVVYLRALKRGACDYVDDGKLGPFPHGVCWFEHCCELEVIDVPGDHFSLLRQVRCGRAVETYAACHENISFHHGIPLAVHRPQHDTSALPACLLVVRCQPWQMCSSSLRMTVAAPTLPVQHFLNRY